MSSLVLTVINLAVFCGLLAFLNFMARKYVKFPRRVFAGLGLGVIFGIALQVIYGTGSPVIGNTMSWMALVGSGYVNLLRMIVMPLIIVSIMGALLNLNHNENVGKTGGQILLLLVGTTAIAALVGIGSALLFKLEAPAIQTEQTAARAERLESLAAAGTKSIPDQILAMLPANPFLDMTGERDTSTIAVVIFSAFFAIACLQLAKKKPDSFKLVQSNVNALHDVVMRMVTLILRLTPYGVLALISRMIATSAWADILQLIKFVVASYAAILVMFVIHLLIIASSGLNPIVFIKKAWPALVFGFVSRTSAGAIPINIEAQRKQMGVSEASANLSASLGVAIGQNGCAGIYPAMVAMMIFMSDGTPLTAALLIKLVLVTAISSFGVAGVGGGATFAAIIVLSIMGLPVGLAGLLIAIEPLIDMGRTALNVSDSMMAGVVSSRWQKTLNTDTYYNMHIEVDAED